VDHVARRQRLFDLLREVDEPQEAQLVFAIARDVELERVAA
jgi:hypothetical protein